MNPDTFPRQFARTQRLTLGEPRNLLVSVDGQRVIFLRSTHGSDLVNSLWVLDRSTNLETCVADPRVLLSQDAPGAESIEERSRRERMREGAGGIVDFSCDADAQLAVFTLSGRLFKADIQRCTAKEISIVEAANSSKLGCPIFDPRISPIGKHIAYVRNGSLFVCDLEGREFVVADDPHPEISWGMAEFVAAEEMGRQRGYWWSPDGVKIAACRVDVSSVAVAWISDPTDPTVVPRAHRYPFAGTSNAQVELYLVDLEGNSIPIKWNGDQFPYLNSVDWGTAGLIASIQSRDQRRVQIHAVDPASGSLTLRHEETDDTWVELVAGVPRILDSGQVLHCADRNNSRALCIDGSAITEPTIQVRSVIGVCNSDVLISFNPTDDPLVLHLGRLDTATHTLEILTDTPGIHSGALGGETVIIRRSTLTESGSNTFVRNGPTLSTYAETPLVRPNVTLHRVGANSLATAIVLPHNHNGEPLPILFDAYGGPHVQRVIAAQSAYLTSQWFADQGFCVVVVDGRGTPGRGAQWEREISGDLASGILADQIEVLVELPRLVGNVDLTRVAIRGWSFGGFLAALAVLQAPEHFHAAIAGAPVTDWRLYDTHYTERYLGDPHQLPQNYELSSLTRLANKLSRPLLLVHGLADDNVFAAHSLQLSGALLASGRAHEVLPLSGITHMTTQEVVAENLLLHQLAFLKRSLVL